MAFTTHTKQDMVYLASSHLPGVAHGFSTRKGGVSPAPWDSLNLRPGQGDGPIALEENYRRFCGALGVCYDTVVLSHQVHETTVREVSREDAGKGLWQPRDYTADALITRESGLTLFVFSADCGIILLHDPASGAIGAVHAGWRGCAAGIVEKTVKEMHLRYGTNPRDLRAAIGPAIGPCCFETDSDVPAAMTAALGGDAKPYITPRGNKWYVDLSGLNRQWLLRAGLSAEQIDVSPLCTACHQDLFWSHRKVGDARGVQAGAICCPVREEAAP